MSHTPKFQEALAWPHHWPWMNNHNLPTHKGLRTKEAFKGEIGRPHALGRNCVCPLVDKGLENITQIHLFVTIFPSRAVHSSPVPSDACAKTVPAGYGKRGSIKPFLKTSERARPGLCGSGGSESL